MIGLCAIPFLGVAQSVSNPVIDAVMAAYAEELEKTPNDYNLLFARANQYFLMGEYLKALNDLNEAMKYTTRDDKAVLFDEYILRAEIYENRGEMELALADLIEANKIDPTSIEAIYRLAELNYATGNYDNAKIGYEQILRMDRLNYHAMYGLARVAVKQNNNGLAREYSDNAIKLFPTQADVFVNRANINKMLDKYDAAAHDLLSAVSLDFEKSNALQELVDMSNSHYLAVINSLDDAIKVAPNSAILIYIRSIIQLDHNNYAKALTDINLLIDKNLFTSASIYADCAEALYNLGKYDLAMQRVNTAIMQDATLYSSFILKSNILSALKKDKDALDVIQSVLEVEPNDIDALIEKSIILTSLGDSKKVLQPINDAILNNPENTYSYIVRGWIQNSLLKNTSAAKSDYQRVLTITDENRDDPYRVFALHFLGRNAEAKTLMESIIDKTNESNGELLYYAAALYAQCGDIDQALNYVEGALANGYGSYHNLTMSNTAGISIAPLRKLPAFKALLTKYNKNFE